MKVQILSHLICPFCHSTPAFLIYKKTKERALDAGLNCKKCGRKFYIRNEIACFPGCRRKQFGKNIWKLRKMTIEQEIPKKWMHFYSKQEIKALKKEWDWMLSIVSKKKGTVHLDFATGTGRFLRNIIPKTKGEIVALEQDYPTCQELQYFLKKIKKYSRVSIICADAGKMPFKDDTFNSITSWHGLDEPKMGKAVEESKRLLKRGGYFTASGIHYKKGTKSFLRAKKYKIRFITEKAITQVLREAGFREIEHKTFFEGRWNEAGSYLPVFNEFYSTYAVRAKK